jgi:hypothetical protein
MYKYNLFFFIDRLFIFFEIYILKAFILAIDSFGFETDLRTHTAGPVLLPFVILSLANCTWKPLGHVHYHPAF